MYLHWWGPWWMWFYGHGGKPVWHNYRESFQLHWCNLCVICQWLRDSIRSQARTSAPHHKTKINKKTPTQLSLHYLIERGRWRFKYRRGCLSSHPIHDDLNISVYGEKTAQDILSSSKMTQIQPVWMKNKWPQSLDLLRFSHTVCFRASAGF